MEESTTPAEPQRNKMNPMLIFGILALLIVGGAVFIMNQGKSNSQDSTPNATDNTQTQTPSPTTSTNVMTKSEVKEFQVEAGSFFFTPSEIRVKKGDKVKIVMTSNDAMHDFNIDELGVKIPVTQAGKTNTVEFTADQIGSFEYYCGVGSHRENGQVGTLIVE